MIINSVRDHRLRAGITQEELAKRCSVSRQTIIALERGGYEPSLGLAFRTSRALGVEIHRLYDWVDQ